MAGTIVALFVIDPARMGLTPPILALFALLTFLKSAVAQGVLAVVFNNGLGCYQQRLAGQSLASV